METLIMDKDICVFYITATSFPEGIMGAHEKLHALVPFTANRKYFGISRPENGGKIVYKAAAEELQAGEAKKINLKTMVIPQGTYKCISIKNYVNDPLSIKMAFEKILQQPDLDPNGYCVEWYLNEKDVKCMIRTSS
jgi:predicted transcriptional regulator YdeE